VRTAALLVGCLLGVASTAHADGFRCGERLVSVGESIGEVQLKCGSPTTRDQRTEVRGSESNLATVTIETWMYNLGPHDFVRVLSFVDGTLRRIETGGYGK
jgi:hypothetical protein